MRIFDRLFDVVGRIPSSSSMMPIVTDYNFSNDIYVRKTLTYCSGGCRIFRKRIGNIQLNRFWNTCPPTPRPYNVNCSRKIWLTCAVINVHVTTIWWRGALTCGSCVVIIVHGNWRARYYYMVEGSPHVWLTCTVINVHVTTIWWRGALMCGSCAR